MNRRTDIYDFSKIVQSSLGFTYGYVAWRPAGFNIACMAKNQVCGTQGATCRIHNPEHVWEPRILQYGLNLYESFDPGTEAKPATLDTVQCLLSFMNVDAWYDVVQSNALTYLQKVAELSSVPSVCNFPLDGWYRGVGDVTPRQSYGSNGGKGYLVPRQSVGPQEVCVSDKGYQPLVCTFIWPDGDVDISDPGCLMIDWEWERREL